MDGPRRALPESMKTHVAGPLLPRAAGLGKRLLAALARLVAGLALVPVPVPVRIAPERERRR